MHCRRLISQWFNNSKLLCRITSLSVFILRSIMYHKWWVKRVAGLIDWAQTRHLSRCLFSKMIRDIVLSSLKVVEKEKVDDQYFCLSLWVCFCEASRHQNWGWVFSGLSRMGCGLHSGVVQRNHVQMWGSRICKACPLEAFEVSIGRVSLKAGRLEGGPCHSQGSDRWFFVRPGTKKS